MLLVELDETRKQLLPPCVQLHGVQVVAGRAFKGEPGAGGHDEECDYEGEVPRHLGMVRQARHVHLQRAAGRKARAPGDEIRLTIDGRFTLLGDR
jgi:hypothetical protein